MRSARRSLLVIVALAALSGCERSAQPVGYPRDWPAPLPGPRQGVTCADLSGRYQIGDGAAGVLIRRPSGPNDHGIHWHTVEIATEGTNGLALTFFGSGLEEDVGAPPRVRTVSLGPQRCHDGWVRRDFDGSRRARAEPSTSDGRSERRYLLFARDRSGNLLAQEVVERYMSFSVWAPGGTEVRVPFTGSIDRSWSRWMAVTEDPRRPPVNPLAQADEPLLRALGRRLPPDAEVIARRAEGAAWLLDIRLANHDEATLLEERLLSSSEFGDAQLLSLERRAGGAVVASLRVAPPRQRAPDADRVAAAQAERDRTEAMIRRVLPLLAPCASVTGVRPLDGGYLIDVRCPDAEALSTFVGRLRDSPAFGIPELRRNEPYARAQVSASIWVRER